MPITHAFVSAKADGADTTLVQPTDWNDPHVILDDDGWVAAGETWTYASATTFTVPTNLTAKYTKGTKIKLTQTTAKYFYVVSSSYGAPNTTVTVAAGSDYSLANAAITLPFYSYAATPQGHPIKFNYTPVWTSSGGAAPSIGSGTLQGHFWIVGSVCFFHVYLVGAADTTWGGDQFILSYPVTAVSSATYDDVGIAVALDFGTMNYFGFCFTFSTTTFKCVRDATTGPFGVNTPFTWTTNDKLSVSGRVIF